MLAEVEGPRLLVPEVSEVLMGLFWLAVILLVAWILWRWLRDGIRAARSSAAARSTRRAAAREGGPRGEAG